MGDRRQPSHRCSRRCNHFPPRADDALRRQRAMTVVMTGTGTSFRAGSAGIDQWAYVLFHAWQGLADRGQHTTTSSRCWGSAETSWTWVSSGLPATSSATRRFPRLVGRRTRRVHAFGDQRDSGLPGGTDRPRPMDAGARTRGAQPARHGLAGADRAHPGSAAIVARCACRTSGRAPSSSSGLVPG